MSAGAFPWRTLLFVSVAINLLVIGAVVGAYSAGVRVQRESGEAIVARAPGVRAFLAALPPEARPHIRREFGESWHETRDLRRAAMDARREAYEAAAAEPYDAARVRAAYANLRAADQAVIGVFHDNMADVFADLTPEQRRDVLARLRRAPPAAREVLAPVDEAGDGATIDGEGREALRERMRERRRAWRERQEQRQQQP